jgi:nickel-dependent lactate racemase
MYPQNGSAHGTSSADTSASTTVEVPYGSGTFTLRVPEEGFSLLSSGDRTPENDILKEVVQAREFHRYADKKTLCIVNDGTRPTRTRAVIDEGGLECHYIVATGAHASPTEEELRYIFGPGAGEKRILIHDARQSPCRFIGSTRRNTPVRFNEAIFTYERILVIGSVEPHYFAGFTGGRKGLLPGVAAYDTIERNHAHYFSPGAKVLELQGNPVHEDMMEAIDLLDIPILSLNMVLTKSGEVLGAFSGSLGDSLLRAAELAQSYYAVEIEREADLVVACAPYPMDADLYQSHKALLNGARACRTGGKIVLVSQCRNGIGPSTFYELMTSHRDLGDLLSFARDNYRLGYHKAASLAEILQQHQVSMISDLPPGVLPAVHMRPSSPHELERLMDSVSDEGGTIYYIPEASIAVPRVVPADSGTEAVQGIAEC